MTDQCSPCLHNSYHRVTSTLQATLAAELHFLHPHCHPPLFMAPSYISSPNNLVQIDPIHPFHNCLGIIIFAQYGYRPTFPLQIVFVRGTSTPRYEHKEGRFCSFIKIWRPNTCGCRLGTTNNNRTSQKSFFSWGWPYRIRTHSLANRPIPYRHDFTPNLFC